MKALLVIDVQKGDIEKYNKNLVMQINQRIQYAVEKNEMIIYCMNTKKLRSGIKTNALAEGLSICSPYIIEKEAASVFSNNELLDLLRQGSIAEIEIVGIDGNSCIAYSAKDAHRYGYKVILSRDYIGVRNEERFKKTEEGLAKIGIAVI